MKSCESSFQKKVRSQKSIIPGTKSSVQNAQLLVSTGIPSLDYILGGGQPVGTVLLLEEDAYNEYANIILKYFLAEGAVCGHSLFFGGLENNTEAFLNELPAPLLNRPNQEIDDKHNDETLKIAWRYENKNPINTNLENKNIFGHNFDLSKIMDKSISSKINICLWNEYIPDSYNDFCYYEHFFEKLSHEISNNKFTTSANIEFSERNILRIGIQSLFSPFWQQSSNSKQNLQVFCKFLYKLRALLRSAFAVALITVPVHITKSKNFSKLRHIADICMGLESFTGSARATNPLFKEYNGLFYLHKVAAINSLASSLIQNRDLAFKLRRKKFCIEKLHLPPELQESSEREQDDTSISCGTIKNHLLEF